MLLKTFKLEGIIGSYFHMTTIYTCILLFLIIVAIIISVIFVDNILIPDLYIFLPSSKVEKDCYVNNL